MKTGLLVSVVLFLIACCLPALEFKGDRGLDVMFGARALVVGWSGLFAAVWGWFANPFWVLALFLGLLHKRVPAVIAGGIAIAIACTVVGDIGRQLPGDEGNVTHTAITRLLPGFYVWVASLATVPLVALVRAAK